jgi:hypothetical protein
MQTISEKPAHRTAARTGCYLYAVIDSAAEGPLGLFGLDGGPVYTLGDGRFAAVVSDFPAGKVRPERRRLAAHHGVLEALGQGHTVLPMSFGVVADGPDAIRLLLAHNRDALADQAARVAGKVEMGLRVVWDVPNIFEYFVYTHPELRSLRDQMFRCGREPGREEKIELGRTFDRVLSEERTAQTEKVLAALGPRCAEIKENKVRNEREVMNLACLIRRDGRRTFEEAVIAAAGRFDNHYAFDFNGPWPPHNFVEVELRVEPV